MWIALASFFAASTKLSFIKLSQYTHILAITVLIAAMATSEDRVRRLLYAVATAVGLLGAKGALDYVLTGGQYRMQGPGGLMTEENEYALALNMAIPILFLLAGTEPRRWARWALRLGGVGCAITVIGTHSRSGFLGLATAALLVTMYSRRKVIGVVALALAGVLFIFVAPKAAMQRYETINSEALDSDASVIGRLQAWETALYMVKAHPLLGVGPMNFESQFSHYSAYHPRAPHNAYIALAAESGIPSALLFVGFLLGTIRQMWFLWFRLRRVPGAQRLASFCLAVHSSLIVYMVPNFFINRQNQDLMYHMIGIAAGLAVLAQRRIAAERRQHFEPAIEEQAVLEPVNA